MKVLILYEDQREIEAAMRLRQVLNKAGSMFANAEVMTDSYGGMNLRMNPGPAWRVVTGVASIVDYQSVAGGLASAMPFYADAKPPKPPRPKPPKGVRDLIFEEDDQ